MKLQAPLALPIDDAYRASVRLPSPGIEPGVHEICGTSTGQAIELERKDYQGKSTHLVSVLGRLGGAAGHSLHVHDVTLKGNFAGTNQDKQRSALIHVAGAIDAVTMERVHIADSGDGVKFGGSHEAKTDTVQIARNLTMREVTATRARRGLLVIQSGAENIRLEQINTWDMPEGAIDSEATGTELPGPRTIRIREAVLNTVSPDGRRPEWGVSLGGAGGGELALRDCELASVESDSGLWIRDAVDVRGTDCHFSSDRHGLQINKAVIDTVFSASSFAGKRLAAKISFHGSARPERIRFYRCEFTSDGAYCVTLDSALDVEFVDCIFNCRSTRVAVLVQNQMEGVQTGRIRFSGRCETNADVLVRAEARPGTTIESVSVGSNCVSKSKLLEKQGQVT